MPPKEATAGANEGDTPQGMTNSELRFIKAVFDNMLNKPDANWDKVAQDMGLKNAKSAKERFRQMSIRHGWRDQQQPGTPRKSTDGKVSKVKKTRAPRKKVVKAEEDEDDNDEEYDVIKAEDDDDVVKADEEDGDAYEV
ncbi:hypothetical protein CDD80_5048 [Ophiocordyceps camponoti-rufipedis]|uniref:Myb-like domain-containing protein n=1 Tax=Ophiocordyceps camponoti-rufipedis TaxID=2004952 RepID=A0A2C5YW05_9HYPO|nr:hypothetical protein CDD80_5048 [Ophiocordyceps camponoti-rufipedis]